MVKNMLITVYKKPVTRELSVEIPGRFLYITEVYVPGLVQHDRQDMDELFNRLLVDGGGCDEIGSERAMLFLKYE